MSIVLNIVDPGTIGDYDDLVAKVAAWLDRDDLGPRIPDFVALLEARLNRLLRTLLQETRALWTVTGDTFYLPSDFRKVRALSINGECAPPLVETAIKDLANYNLGTCSRAYALEGRTLRFAPAATVDEPMELDATYWTRIPPLGVDQPTNWLLVEHPDIYVWGALHQAAIYIRDPDAIDACDALLNQAISELQDMSRKDQWGGPLAPAGVRQVPGAKC